MRHAVEATANHDQGTVAVQGLMRPAVEATSNHDQGSVDLEGLNKAGTSPAELSAREEAILSSLSHRMVSVEETQNISKVSTKTNEEFYPMKRFNHKKDLIEAVNKFGKSVGKGFSVRLSGANKVVCSRADHYKGRRSVNGLKSGRKSSLLVSG